jgi:hypothetical protein
MTEMGNEPHTPATSQPGNPIGHKSESKRPPSTRAEIIISSFTGLMVLTYLTANYFSCKQLRLTRDALKSSSDSFEKTLFQMKAQTEAMQKFATAADTANKNTTNALHISERAYISIGQPQLDWASVPPSIAFPLNNSGHIPSGDIQIIVHEATFESTTVLPAFDSRFDIAHSWKRFNFPPAPPGSPFSFGTLLKGVSKEKFESGFQGILLAGEVGYYDGFPDDAIQKWHFCTQTRYQAMSKKMNIAPCDARKVIPFLEHLDGYPKNEQSD